MELIDRKSAINAVLGLKNCYNGFSDTYDKSCIVGLLDELPKVDAVPVVRCKDCKFYLRAYDCPFGILAIGAPDRMGYCFKAERKDDDKRAKH